MPGGAIEAWPAIKPIFQSVAAKAEPDKSPCCDWVGADGSGHFVKMVHNGIEYGDMQLIAEAYHLLRNVCALTQAQMADVFTAWNKTELDSYLIEITADILRYVDPATGQPVLDRIMDAAGQKGTGKWTAITALDYGVPVTLIGEAVFARCLSSLKPDRLAAAALHADASLMADAAKYKNNAAFIDDIRQALYASKIVSYAQGFMLLRHASHEYNWALNYGAIALMWRGGCIIRSAFLGDIKHAFDRDHNLNCLLMDEFFVNALKKASVSRFIISVTQMSNCSRLGAAS